MHEQNYPRHFSVKLFLLLGPFAIQGCRRDRSEVSREREIEKNDMRAISLNFDQ